MNEQELVGVTLGNYTLERVIGKGGMAIVFLAQQARPMRTVAVKVLLPDTTGDDPEQQRVFLERFRREADTAAKLKHKNILPVYDYAEAMVKGTHLPYLVMPYIRGGTLRQRIDEMRYEGKSFDLQTVADYVDQIADALSYAHSLGIVHRDVKPGNLLFSPDGHLLLADFGIVRLNTLPSLTIAGSFVGTAEYASPEQVSAGEVDARSDIYALGIILYELLVGSVPFTGSTPFAVMAQQLRDPVPSVRASRPDLSPAIEFVVRKALAKDPNSRYQYATELAADLRAAITPALAQQASLRLNGNASNSDPTVADSNGQPPARAVGITTPMGRAVNAPMSQVPLQASVPSVQTVTKTKPAVQPVSSIPTLPPPAGGASWQATPVQMQLPPVTPYADESDQVKAYRPGQRLYFYIVSLVTLVSQVVVLGLIFNRDSASGPYGNTTAIVLGVLLGNALNLVVLAAIGFTGITRQRSIRGVLNRVLWTMPLVLILSGFFISYGEFSSQSLDLPWISYVLLVLSNIFSLRELSRVDVAHEQVEVAPVYWRSALIGALTGLLPLTLLLVFAMLVPLPWVANSSLFLRLLGILIVAFIGAPTPGSTMAVWLSHKMSFSILVRTSALAGLFMFVAAYLLVIVASWLIDGQTLFSTSFGSQVLVAMLVMGALLGLIGLLRGMLDAWIYHRVMIRRP